MSRLLINQLLEPAERGHWAAEIPNRNQPQIHIEVDAMASQAEYDVALSFAGPDRKYVEAVAESLRELNISVFYDKFEESNLWGKDLYQHLSDVYTKQSLYTVMFISKAYAKSVWPTHERSNAQERALKESSEYVLPVRFDDTPVPGLRETIGYVDARLKDHATLAKLIAEKVKRRRVEMGRPAFLAPGVSQAFIDHLVKSATTYHIQSLITLVAACVYATKNSGLASDGEMHDKFFLEPLRSAHKSMSQVTETYFCGHHEGVLEVLESIGLIVHSGEAEQYFVDPRLVNSVKRQIRSVAMDSSQGQRTLETMKKMWGLRKSVVHRRGKEKQSGNRRSTNRK